jgi:hypothetical protein
MEKLAARFGKALKWKDNKEREVNFRSIEERAHYFFVVAQYRVLMQLEQVIGLAEKSPVFNSLLQDNITPQKLQQLVELLAQAHPAT